MFCFNHADMTAKFIDRDVKHQIKQTFEEEHIHCIVRLMVDFEYDYLFLYFLAWYRDIFFVLPQIGVKQVHKHAIQ